MVERREERFFALLQDKFRLVLDRDDERRHGYGEYYTSRNVLTLERLMPVIQARPEGCSDTRHEAGVRLDDGHLCAS